MFRILKPQIFLLAILICGFASCNSYDPPSRTQPKASTGSSAPPNTSLPMPPVNGASINNLGWNGDGGKRSVFPDFKGKVVVLDF